MILWRRRLLGVWALSMLVLNSAVARDSSSRIASLLAQEERPSMSQIRSIDREEAEAFLGAESAESLQERAIFAVYETIIRELQETPNDMQIFIFARDGEGLYDAIDVGGDESLRRRVHLVNISRPVARNPDSALVLRALNKMGMSIDHVLSGSRRMMWLDTGNRGSIFIDLLNHMLSTVGEFPYRRGDIVRHVFDRIDMRLIAARSTNQADRFLDYIVRGGDVSRPVFHSAMMSHLYFKEIPSRNRDALGIPPGETEKWQWVTQNIEYQPKWNGRATGLSDSGDPIITIESREVGRIDRPGYLRHQLRILRRFAPREERDTMRPLPTAKESFVPFPIGESEWTIAPRSGLSESMVRELLHQIRHGEGSEDRKRGMDKMKEILSTHAGQEFLLEHMSKSRRFAHFVASNATLLPEEFLNSYRSKIMTIERASAHERALKTCEEFLKGSK